jgi:predicted Zn-dependent protease
MKTRLTLIALIVLSVTILGQRTKLKPGNPAGFSPADDVRLGQEVARDAEKELNLITNREVTNYVSTLGQRLLAKAPNDNKFPFTFKVVDERSINAFALPGGPVYVHRGAIEAADNEAQIAGVMGHEIAHIILRHGTSQASKGQLFGGLAGIVGGLLGDSRLGQAAAIGGTLAANGFLLKYSRGAESDADLMGTQILYDSGYAPRAMAEFFDKLAKEHKGSKIEELFSNHPIPENRVGKVNAEIKKLGPELRNPKIDSPEFQSSKRILLAMPEPKPKPKPTGNASGSNPGSNSASAAPALPSTRMISFQNTQLQLQHPDNWKPATSGTSVALAPAGGANDRGDLGYGMIIDVFKPTNARSLDEATTQFIDSLRQSNPNMKITRSRVPARVDGRTAQLTEITNDSPFGGTETDIVVTLFRTTTELQYFVQVAPSKDMARYRQAFQNIMNSVRLK